MKRRRKDFFHSYQEPSLVPLSEKDKVSRINQAREFGKLGLYLWYSEEGASGSSGISARYYPKTNNKPAPRLVISPKIRSIDLLPPDARIKESHSDEQTVVLWRSPKITEIPKYIEVDEDVGWLIGFWHAEGQKGKRKTYKLALGNSNTALVERFMKIFREQISHKEKIKIYARPEVGGEIKSNPFAGFKNVNVVVEKNSKFSYTKPHYRIDIVNKVIYFVLSGIFERSKNIRDFRLGYVAGFIDGDGYISKEGRLDIRMEKCDHSKAVYGFIKLVLEGEGFPIREYLKRQYRMQITSKRYAKRIANTFPIHHDFKLRRLASS